MAVRSKNKQIIFYVSDEELVKLKNNVAKSKLKQSQFLRYVALEKEIVVIQGLEDFVLQVKKIGTNINQIAKILNSGDFIDCRKHLELTQKELNRIWLTLSQLVEKVP